MDQERDPQEQQAWDTMAESEANALAQLLATDGRCVMVVVIGAESDDAGTTYLAHGVSGSTKGGAPAAVHRRHGEKASVAQSQAVLADPADALMRREPTAWVPGWSSQLILIVLTGMGLWVGARDMSAIYITGSLVIGVMRQIERDRRGPPPGSKV